LLNQIVASSAFLAKSKAKKKKKKGKKTNDIDMSHQASLPSNVLEKPAQSDSDAAWDALEQFSHRLETERGVKIELSRNVSKQSVVEDFEDGPEAIQLESAANASFSSQRAPP